MTFGLSRASLAALATFTISTLACNSVLSAEQISIEKPIVEKTTVEKSSVETRSNGTSATGTSAVGTPDNGTSSPGTPSLERSSTVGPLGEIIPVDGNAGEKPLEKNVVDKPSEPERVPREEVREIRPLPGGLDSIPVFNSNSPEIVMADGVLLSTFPSSEGPAHLNFSFDGRFDIFAHHVADGKKSGHTEELYFGFLVGNTGEKPVKVQILNGASYVSQPDAPFVALAPYLDNDEGQIFAGPGDRVTDELLRDEKTPEWKSKIVVPPGKTVLLKSLPLRVMFATPHSNGRSVIARLKSNGPVHLALVSKYAIPTSEAVFREPTEEEYLSVLDKGELVHPRDVAPTRPEEKGALKYGRVSGVASGSTWKARVTDRRSRVLALPTPEKPIGYPIAALKQGTFGTGQVQSAPLVVRYEDTAYQAHGNYGVKYDLTFPLKNTSDRDLKFKLVFETPIKSDAKKDQVTFYEPYYNNVFFRGTIKVSTGSGKKAAHYKHLVEHRGESVTPLLTEVLSRGETRIVRVELLYPPDCTPPQLLTLSTSTDVE
ncbi:MAG: DUF3370 domain-containing protein [Candidatus Melainabacteria bacterium]|nr:DUF3370 domain-containing protein [Candidatus Melainabacteria bacterium]